MKNKDTKNELLASSCDDCNKCHRKKSILIKSSEKIPLQEYNHES